MATSILASHPQPLALEVLLLPADGDWSDLQNPFSYLGSAAGEIVANGWTAAMLGLWNAGLWMLKLVLNLTDSFLTPDLSASGPGENVYPVTFWIAVSLVVILVMVQLGVAAFRRDGKSLATSLIGVGQFVIVWVGWLAYGAAVIAACGGLTKALMSSLLGVHSWGEWQPWSEFSTGDIADGTVATVLGLLGMVLWIAAIGHLLVMLARAGALMVLVATAPISAAGLVGDAGRAWFWKSLRWFHAAAFTPILMVLVLGIGVQMTTGVATGQGDDRVQSAVGTAVPGVVLILISAFAPLALFKLLAFVDPSTSSGAAMRQGLSAHGGLQGLVSGRGGSGSAAGSTASSTDDNGRASGESSGEDATTQRFLGSMGLLGASGSMAGAGLGFAATVGSRAAAIGSDLTNQMGVGSHSYQPDFTGSASGPRRAEGTGPGPRGSSAEADADPSAGAGGAPLPVGAVANAITPPPPHTPPSSVAPPGGSDEGGGRGSGAQAAGGARVEGGSDAAPAAAV